MKCPTPDKNAPFSSVANCRWWLGASRPGEKWDHEETTGAFCGKPLIHWSIISFPTFYTIITYRRKFRSQTSDNMDRWKAEVEQKNREEKSRRGEERRAEKRKSQKKEDPGARKGRKVAKHCVFPMICGSGGSKSRLAKAAGAEPAGQMRDEKLHAVVARSTFPSQNVQNTSASECF